MKILLLFICLSFQFKAFSGEILRAIEASTDLKVQVLPDGKKIVAGKNGMTLYTFDNDNAGISTCFNGCLIVWPILETVQSNILAPFSIQTRSDGKKQISFENHPLYYYAPDKVPGDIKGDGVHGVWHIVEIKE